MLTLFLADEVRPWRAGGYSCVLSDYPLTPRTAVKVARAQFTNGTVTNAAHHRG